MQRQFPINSGNKGIKFQPGVSKGFAWLHWITWMYELFSSGLNGSICNSAKVKFIFLIHLTIIDQPKLKPHFSTKYQPPLFYFSSLVYLDWAALVLFVGAYWTLMTYYLTDMIDIEIYCLLCSLWVWYYPGKT